MGLFPRTPVLEDWREAASGALSSAWGTITIAYPPDPPTTFAVAAVAGGQATAGALEYAWTRRDDLRLGPELEVWAELGSLNPAGYLVLGVTAVTQDDGTIHRNVGLSLIRDAGVWTWSGYEEGQATSSPGAYYYSDTAGGTLAATPANGDRFGFRRDAAGRYRFLYQYAASSSAAVELGSGVGVYSSAGTAWAPAMLANADEAGSGVQRFGAGAVMTELGVLAGDDLEAARADLESSWPGTAVLYSPGTVVDATGGWAESWTVQGTVAAVLHPLSSAEGPLGGGVIGQRAYVLSCPASVELGEEWRVDYEGRSYRVAGVTAWGPAEIATRATLSEVSSEAV